MLETFALSVWENIVFFRYEILSVVVLVGAELIRRRHGSNKTVAAFIDFMSKQVVEQMEAQQGAPVGQTDSRRKKVQRKVRRQIAKEARKANRGSKGGKTNSEST